MDKIDRDMDGKITKEELKSWIQYTQRRYILEDVDRQWKAHNPNNKDSITWEEYKKMVYGFMDDMEPSELENNADEGFSYKDMIRRDQRRWGIADTNGDHALDKVLLQPFTVDNQNQIVDIFFKLFWDAGRVHQLFTSGRCSTHEGDCGRRNDGGHWQG